MIIIILPILNFFRLFPPSSSAKNSVKLTKKYGKCLPNEGQEGMSNVYRNMRFVSRIICDNVNKRSEYRIFAFNANAINTYSVLHLHLIVNHSKRLLLTGESETIQSVPQQNPTVYGLHCKTEQAGGRHR